MKQYIKDGVIKTRKNIIVRKDGLQYINPTEDLILSDGWVEYIPETTKTKPREKTKYEVVQDLVIKQWNERTDITDSEALDYMVIVYPWSSYIGKELVEGKIVSDEGKLWRVRQTHQALENHKPSMSTAALFEVIEKEHTGELNDPIPYNPPMEILEGKYYSEDGVVYLCTRNSGTALSHNLKDLIGLYVSNTQ